MSRVWTEIGDVILRCPNKRRILVAADECPCPAPECPISVNAAFEDIILQECGCILAYNCDEVTPVVDGGLEWCDLQLAKVNKTFSNIDFFDEIEIDGDLFCRYQKNFDIGDVKATVCHYLERDTCATQDFFHDLHASNIFVVIRKDTRGVVYVRQRHFTTEGEDICYVAAEQNGSPTWKLYHPTYAQSFDSFIDLEGTFGLGVQVPNGLNDCTFPFVVDQKPEEPIAQPGDLGAVVITAN